MLNKINKKVQVLIFSIVLGIGPTVFGAYMLHQQSVYTKTTATITKIIETYDASNDINHEVYVTYDIDGKTYNEQLPYYEGGYVEGKEVRIAYDENDPTKITTGEKGFGIYLVIIGPIIFICGLINFLFGR